MFRGRGARGRGGRGGAAPHMMRGVGPRQLKPGRGMMMGGAPMPRGALVPRRMPIRQMPGPMAMGGGPMVMVPRPRMRVAVPRPYAPPMPVSMVRPMRGGRPPYPHSMQAGMPARGRGRGRGRGATAGRGRGRGRGRGAVTTSTAKATATDGKGSLKNRSRTEKERDKVDVNRPWVTEEMRAEIVKKQELQKKSLETKDPKDFEAFKEQRNKVTAMLRAAKLEYIGSQEEQDVEKILAEAAAKAKSTAAEAKKANNAESNGTAQNGEAADVAETPADDTVKTEDADGDVPMAAA